MSDKLFDQTATHEKLKAHQKSLKETHLGALIEGASRFDDFSHVVEGILFDFSKQRITRETLHLLEELAVERGLANWRKRLFAGEKINNSENRAVQHMALRAPAEMKLFIDGQDIVAGVHAELAKMREFSDRVRMEKTITHVVNIGIGGSDLGPRFVNEALRPYHDGPEIRFVSNVDAADLESALDGLDAKSTLFVIASKTFTTYETMLNAASAREWFLSQGMTEADIGDHFVALSTNQEKVQAFGIDPDNMFRFQDWVGGRYSVWCPIGLSIMLAIGHAHFDDFLAGAHAADRHFMETPLQSNIPFLLGMIGIWNRNYFNLPTLLFAPYDQRLGKLAKYMQQMDMESNGKHRDRDGHCLAYDTGPQVYGETGTDSQHSYMQLVHQGTDIIPLDFIGVAAPHHRMNPAHHRALIANMQAQSRALAKGQTLEQAKNDPCRVYPGNRPSTTILLPALTPRALGTLMAFYEHKIFVQGAIWNLNSYDQPGVELGKTAAVGLIDAYEKGVIPDDTDPSTRGQMQFVYKYLTGVA